MKHLGDITKLDGAKLPPVDIITGGSPCQDLSVAGKREGLAGERSGLFMEQVRIVKEMRRATNGEKPKQMLWENVCGAFSSNGGEDFRAVIEEIARIADKDAVIPGPPKGKWTHAGCVVGDGWSIAWSVHDAQFWGVPQRRKRIALVADFRSERAAEILFERKGMSGDTAESGEAREEAAGDFRESAPCAVGFHLTQDPITSIEKSPCISSGNPVNGQASVGVMCLNDQGGSVMGVSEDVSWALRMQEHGHQPIVFEPGAASRVGSHVYEDGVAGTVRANAGDNQQAVVTLTTEMTPKIDENGIAFSLRERDYKDAPCVAYGIGSYNSEGMLSPNPHSGIYEADTARTLDNNGGNPACNQGGMMVVQSAGFDGNMGAKAGNIGYEEEKAPTLNAGKQMHVVFDASRRHNYEPFGNVCETVQAAYGTGGGNTPIVLEGNGARPSHKGDGYAESDTMYTLNATEHHAVCVENHPADCRVKISDDGIVQTLSGRMGTGGGNVPLIMSSLPICIGNGQANQSIGNVVNTISIRDYKGSQCVMTYQECTGNLDGCISKGVNNQNADNDMLVSNGYIVRRLTPLECERLQMFPDGWTDIGDWVDSKGKKHKAADSPRYKALGNSIALPFWEWLAKRMVRLLKNEEPTMASLFDGISGFCLAFARAGAKPVFSSEIEEYPIAVAKKHFGDDDLELKGDYERYL